MATLYRTRDGDMVDEICWRFYGDRTGAAEAVLEANPGLADRGAILPAGLTVTLPDLRTPQAPAVVRLWD